MLEQILPLLQKDASRGFIRNWFDLRDGRIAPDRRDIDPVRMAGLLPKLWLWEYVEARQDFRCRLAGEEICAVFGRNPRGTFLSHWVPSSVYATARARYRRVIEEPAICLASGNSYVEDNKQAWCERLIAPMTDGGDRPTVVFGLTAWHLPDYSPTRVDREETEARFFPLAR